MSAGAIDTRESAGGYDLYYNHKGKLWAILGTLMVAMLLSALDQMIFGTAMPKIVGELDGVEHMLWVTTAYILAVTLTMPLYGKLSDIIGRKWLLVIGISIFIIGSVLGGLATDMTMLIAGRAIQGIGGGGLMILAQATISDVIPVAKRGKYMGLIGGTFGISSVLGPVLGGWFTDTVGWRWAFWMNLPLAAVSLILIFAFLVPSSSEKDASASKVKFDYLGTITMMVAVTSLVLFTSWGGTEYEWGSPVIIGLIIGFFVFTAAFILVELRASDPLIPLTFFKSKNFTLATIVGLLLGVGMFGTLGYLPTLLQIQYETGATNSGLLLLPMMAGLILMSLISGQIVSKTGDYKTLPVIGAAVAVVGVFLLSTISLDTPLWAVGVYMFIFGMGLGMIMQQLVLIVQQSAGHSHVGVATSTNNFFREIGASLGGAFVGALFTNALTNNLKENLPAEALAGHSMSSLTPEIIAGLPTPIKEVIISAYNSALTPVFLYLVPVFILGFVALLFVQKRAIVDESADSVIIEEEARHAAAMEGAAGKYVMGKNGKLVLASLSEKVSSQTSSVNIQYGYN